MRICQRAWCVATVLVFAVGCTEQPAPSETNERANSLPAGATVEDASQTELPSPPDRSLALDEYIAAGMPAHDRSWSDADMSRAANVLAAIAQNGQLPRYRSERSGAAFERLTADDNLNLFRNPSLPLDQRLPDALNYLQASSEILKLYLIEFNQDAVGGGELVELMGAQLRVTVVLISLVNELLPTLDRDDPTYPVRMQGLQRMKNGMASTVAGSVQTLTESHAYRTSELKRFARYMEATIPDILPELPEGSRSETLIRLRSFLEDPSMQDLRPELDALVAAAEESVPADDGP